MAPRCVVGPSDQKQVWRKLVLAGQEIGCAVLIGHRVDGLAAGRHAGLLHEGHDPAVEVRHLVNDNLAFQSLLVHELHIRLSPFRDCCDLRTRLTFLSIRLAKT